MEYCGESQKERDHYEDNIEMKFREMFGVWWCGLD
jgi:hypothetical protein